MRSLSSSADAVLYPVLVVLVVLTCDVALATDNVPSKSSSSSSAAARSSSSSTGSRVVGDPFFVGLLGQQYQVHGIDGAVYSLISLQYMQLNSRFSFLAGPRPCPVIPSTGRIRWPASLTMARTWATWR